MKLRTFIILALLVFSFVCLQAQDYLISFAGSGASSTVSTVKVENLTQGTNLTISGNDVLHLMGNITGIETINGNEGDRISFYPNPMNDFTKMTFVLPETGETLIALFNIEGRKLVQKQEFLQQGEHTFNIRGAKEGIYFVRINSGRYSLYGRLISSGSLSSNPKIVFESSGDEKNKTMSEEKQSDSKGTNAETVMQYNTGDRLKFTGISDIYSTVIVNVPTESKTIAFEFINCTDAAGKHYAVVTIGNQTWMAENLAYLPSVVGPVTLSDTIPYHYVYGYGGTSVSQATATPFYTTYGVLYNWLAAMAGSASSNANPSGVQGACPLGWHLPSNAEWTELNDYLGGTNVAGGKLKEIGITHWTSPNTGATNETGFTALPGGYRNYPGFF